MNDREAVEFLRELLSLYSPSGAEVEVASCLWRRLSAEGLEVKVDGAGNVIAALGDVPEDEGRLRPDLLLLGHIDTVPGFIPVREEAGKLYGRGAVDAKGPLVAFAAALLRAREILAGRSVVLVGAVGEEAKGEGAKYIIPRFLPKATIIGEPSGWDGITLGYKGRLVVQYAISTPVTHSASPAPSAPEMALGFWRKLSLHARRGNRGRERHFDRLDLSLRHISSFHDGFRDRVEMTIGLRLPPGMGAEGLRREAEALADGASLCFRGGEEAFVAPKNTPLVRAFLRAIRDVGGKPRFKLKTGTSDMNLAGPAWGCPIVAYGPGDSRLDHAPNEHIDLEEFKRGIVVLTKALTAYANT